MKRIVFYDLKKGVLHMWPRFVLSGVLLLLLSMTQARQVEELVRAGMYGRPSFGNYLAVWLKGIHEAVLHVENATRIGLPVEWLMLHFNYMLLLAGYTYTDLRKNGGQLMMRAGGRCGWWGSKCIWAAAVTAVYFLMFYAILACISKATGSMALMPKSEIWISDLDIPSKRIFFGIVFVMLPVSSFTAGLAQILAELVSSPVVALVAGCGYHFAVLYWNSPLFVGNYAMLCRSSRYASAIGSLIFETGVCLLVCLCFYAAGRCYVKKVEF